MGERKTTDVGFDPVRWIDRLLDVTAESQFTDTEKCIINSGLRTLRGKLDPKGEFQHGGKS